MKTHDRSKGTNRIEQRLYDGSGYVLTTQHTMFFFIYIHICLWNVCGAATYYFFAIQTTGLSRHRCSFGCSFSFRYSMLLRLFAIIDGKSAIKSVEKLEESWNEGECAVRLWYTINTSFFTNGVHSLTTLCAVLAWAVRSLAGTADRRSLRSKTNDDRIQRFFRRNIWENLREFKYLGNKF